MHFFIQSELPTPDKPEPIYHIRMIEWLNEKHSSIHFHSVILSPYLSC